ncbi:MAG: ricin-type beta-trefoil lectin domain protein [Marmoricola sp.]
MSSTRRRWWGTLVLVAALAAAGLAIAAPSSADETTIGYDNLRTSWDDAEPNLTSGGVAQPDFGQLWSTTVDGTTASTPNQIYTQPLVIGGMVIVTTEENTVEALNASTGAKVWSVTNLGGPAWTPFSQCGDLVPHVGITSTPVYDPATHLIYLVTKNAAAAGAATLKMHALAPATGLEAAGWPLTLAGSSTNSNEALNPTTAHQRPSLMLLDGAVFFATASHCDKGPYVGFVGRVSTGANPQLKLWSSESGSASNGAGIWQSGGAPMSDGAGRVFVATGNGVSPTPTKGTTPPSTLGESVVRLAVNGDGSMTAKDFFSPANNTALDQDDLDLGSGSPVALPDSFGSVADPHLLVVVGKQGITYLLDRDDLGGMGQGLGGTDKVVSSITGRGVWGRAAAFDGGPGNHYVYTVPSTAPLQAIKVTPNGAGVPTMSVAATSAESFGFTSGSPIVTSEGADAATALVWIVGVDGGSGSNGRLEAYPAVPPTTGPWKPVATFPLGTMGKFIQPATDGGRVFLGTRDGRVLGFGSPTTGAITAAPYKFADQPVGGTEHGTMTLTVNADATITGIAATPPSTFSADAPTPAIGSALHQGDTVSVPVTFAAGAPGTSSGTLAISATTAAGPVAFPFSLSGTATQPGIVAAPGSLAFGNVAVGRGAQQGVMIQNTGTTSEKITSVSALEAPYSIVSPLTLPYTLPALGSVTLTVQYSPTAAIASNAQLVVTTDAGDHNVATIPITGSAFTGSPQLTFDPPALNLGTVLPGVTFSKTFTVTNAGTTTMTISKAAPPSAPFSVASPIDEGQQVEPGDHLTITVQVRPLNAQADRDRYSVTINDGLGPHLLPVSANTGYPVGRLTGTYGCVTDSRLQLFNGTPIINRPCDQSAAQKFMRSAGFGLQLSTVRLGSYCLDIPHASTRPGTAVQLFTCTGGPGQAFVADVAGRLRNPHSGLCLDVRPQAVRTGAPLVIDRCDSSAGQRWDSTALLRARGQLSSRVSVVGRYCFTDPANSARIGTAITFNACTAAPGQIIAHLGRTLRVAGRCVAVARPRAGAALRLAQCSGTPDQVFTTASNGRLYNPASRLCVTVPPHSHSGVALLALRCAGTAGQGWYLPG